MSIAAELPFEGTGFELSELPLRQRVGLEIANLKEAPAVIVKNRYLHRGRTMAQMPYWITFDGNRCGVLLFALPRMSVPFHGHKPMALVELARMWLDPMVQGSRVMDRNGQEHSLSVATCAVGQSLRRIRNDWHGKYPHMPLISGCVSWADDVHHEGTIYRAANFREVGKSGGSLHGTANRRNGGRDQAHSDYLHPKTAFLYEWSRRVPASDLKRAVEAWTPIRPKRPVKKIHEQKAAEVLQLRVGGD